MPDYLVYICYHSEYKIRVHYASSVYSIKMESISIAY